MKHLGAGIMVRYFIYILIFSVLTGSFQLSYGNECSRDYRQEMRKFVIQIKKWVKRYNRNGFVIAQNGYDLLIKDGTPYGNIDYRYFNAIDGQAVESLFYGWIDDNEKTPYVSQQWVFGYLDRLVQMEKPVFSTDYVWDEEKIDDQINSALSRGYIPFPTPCRELNCIPYYPENPVNENNNDITDLSQVQNYLYLINPENFETKRDFIEALSNTNYDMLIIDAFDNDGRWLTRRDIRKLKRKANGGKRLVIAYVSIGEAEDYRWYWRRWWNWRLPSFIGMENPDWEGNYLVKYWDRRWKRIIRVYIWRVMRLGFDGVMLDKIDSFETWEEIKGCSPYN